MATGTFEKTNLDWQLQQLQQQVGEWIELVLFSQNPSFSQQDWTWLDGLLKVGFWLVVGGLVLWAAWWIYQFLPRLNRLLQPEMVQQSVQPVPNPAVAEWLQRSRHARQQGDYREACRALYLAMLQLLGDRKLLPQHPSRTDGEYLDLLKTWGNFPAYQLLIRTHERLCFSDTAISQEIYDRCWRAYQEIERP